jgi:hypothetical protein
MEKTMIEVLGFIGGGLLLIVGFVLGIGLIVSFIGFGIPTLFVVVENLFDRLVKWSEGKE